MNKIIKLRQNFEFKRAYHRGKSIVSPSFVVYIFKNNHSCLRLGLTTGKKLGIAVERNRARRVLTAAFREISPSLQQNYDIVFVARRKILSKKSTDVLSEMQNVFSESGIIKQ